MSVSGKLRMSTPFRISILQLDPVQPLRGNPYIHDGQ